MFSIHQEQKASLHIYMTSSPTFQIFFWNKSDTINVVQEGPILQNAQGPVFVM